MTHRYSSAATSLKEQHRFNEALTEIAKAEALCVDDEDARALASALREAMAQQ